MTERGAYEDFWYQIVRVVDQHINENAVKTIQVLVTAVDSRGYCDVQRLGNTTPDGIFYPVIAPAYYPRVNDWVWADVTPGGLIIRGKNTTSTDLDIPGVRSVAASDATSKANSAENSAKDYAATKANQAENAAKNYADEYKSPKTHGHGGHGHGIASDGGHTHGGTDSTGGHTHGGTHNVGGHTHSYQRWSGTTLWADSVLIEKTTGSGGGHGHGIDSAGGHSHGIDSGGAHNHGGTNSAVVN